MGPQDLGKVQYGNCFGEDFFMGYLHDDVSVSLILVTMVLNKKGSWIAEDITFIARKDVPQLNEELLCKPVEQIEWYRRPKSEQEEIWRQKLKLCKRELDL
ncbi:hypothetical protein BS50DRAFT_641280 [Corynespora cassiicola Philippines]|uniref:Uncharacterized protein n=1 Tax=Corynespora cassiicola Philippines TaxID=1448308 RepID=A0A2T2N109_CORCC|nr:hypothetical protein BS50DRAFT_641280 [Corynespora cassiicola Philippines]